MTGHNQEQYQILIPPPISVNAYPTFLQLFKEATYANGCQSEVDVNFFLPVHIGRVINKA